MTAKDFHKISQFIIEKFVTIHFNSVIENLSIDTFCYDKYDRFCAEQIYVEEIINTSQSFFIKDGKGNEWNIKWISKITFTK